MLSADRIREFENHGFLIVDLDLDEYILDKAITDMVQLYEKNSPQYRHGTRVRDGWQKSQAVHSLAVVPQILSCLEDLYKREPLPFQTLNFPIGTQQKLHSDALHFNSMPSGFMAGVWIALEDVSRENGAVVLYPGSHKFPEYNMQDVGVDVGHENYKEYEAFIEDKIKESNQTPYYAELKKGQALVWHANLIHGGSAQLDKSRTRHSQVTHYFFKGCKYYTPMNSKPDRIAWRKPVWIPVMEKSFIQKVKSLLMHKKSG
jgi:hypothetical protein